MKDFIKWLGVNEKIAKLVVWLFIFMVFLIIMNTALESVGLPYYKVTVENLSKINFSAAIQMIFGWLISYLNYLSFTLLVFNFKDIKKIATYGLLYLILNIIISIVFGYAASQVLIILFMLIFAYLFSNKKIKYVFYMIISLIINTIVQYISYIFKIQFIDYPNLSRINAFLISVDYFVIMFIIIILKEYYLRIKRRKTNG